MVCKLRVRVAQVLNQGPNIRLRVVPRFSSGIVERAKRERA